MVNVATRVCQDKAVDLRRVGLEKLCLSRESCGLLDKDLSRKSCDQGLSRKSYRDP